MIRLIKNASMLIAVLSVACLLNSIAYDTGFFLPLESKLLSLMSISDHIISGISFLPVLIIILIFSITAASITSPQLLDPRDIETNTIKDILLEKFNNMPMNVLVLTLIPTLFILWLVFFPWYEGILLPVTATMFLTPIIVKLLARNIFGLKKITRAAYLTTILSLFSVLTSFGSGFYNAKLSPFTEDYASIHFKDKKTPYNTQILRFLERGILVRSDSEVIFLKDENISSIAYKTSKPDDTIFICRMTPCKQH